MAESPSPPDSAPVSVAPLRGAGPKVFISYSYADRSMAERLARYLSDCGMPVRKEDESSLLGQPLSEVLPVRIADCEVFIQLVTATAARSAWVAREFEWATQPSSTPAVVLPIVLGDAVPPDPVASWGYLPVPVALDAEALDVVRRTAMQGVRTLPLDANAPYQFETAGLRQYTSDSDLLARRTIVDPDGLMLRAVEATVQISLKEKPPHRDRLVAERRRASARLARQLAVHDAFLPLFITRIRPLIRDHAGPEYLWALDDIIQRFIRLTLGTDLLKLARAWQSVVGSVLGAGASACRAANELAEQLQTSNPRLHGWGLRLWALGETVVNDWLELGFEAKGELSDAVVVLPAGAFGKEYARRLRDGATSQPILVLEGHWLEYGLSQAAVRAMQGARSPENVPAAVEQIGLRLDDYELIGTY